MPQALTQPSVAVSPYVAEALWKIQPASAMHRKPLPPAPFRPWLNSYDMRTINDILLEKLLTLCYINNRKREASEAAILTINN